MGEIDRAYRRERDLADDLAAALDRVMDVSDPDCDIREPALRALARYQKARQR